MIEITGWPARIALLAPFGLLLIAVWRTARQAPSVKPAGGEAGRAAAASFAIVSPGALPEPGDGRVPAPEPIAKPPADVGASPPPALDSPDAPLAASPSLIDWRTRIMDAEASNDMELLATSHLACAREEIATGRADLAADQLRSCIRIAAKSRNRAMQAEARLELAELARAAGDLTTACEHWQIARALFHDLERPTERSLTEELMHAHGCPTDWVLNDF